MHYLLVRNCSRTRNRCREMLRLRRNISRTPSSDVCPVEGLILHVLLLLRLFILLLLALSLRICVVLGKFLLNDSSDGYTHVGVGHVVVMALTLDLLLRRE